MSTIIGINTQRNANCVVQASQLNGGNLSQSFNLQAMRIVKGVAALASTTSGVIGGNGQVLVNEYDGSAIELGSNDVIIAGVIENSNSSAPLDGDGATVKLIYAGAPTYNSATVSWTAGTVSGDADSTIVSNLSPTQLNGGVRFTPLGASTSVDQSYWINCITSTNVITTPNPYVNVTLLVLNPGLSM